MKILFITMAICASLGTSLAGSEDYLNRSIPAKERIAEQMVKLRQEVRSPSATRQGMGGPITHEYLLAQFITTFERIVNYYDKRQEKWVNDPVALDELKRVMSSETNSTVQMIMKIALAGAGEPSFEAELIQIIRRPDQPTIRTLAIGALGRSEGFSAIPDLVKLLTDPDEISAGCVPINGEQTAFPVRVAAAFTLNQLGIKVKDLGHGRYEVDPQSLSAAIAKHKNPTNTKR